MTISREGLSAILDQYLDALDDNDPSRLKVTPDVRFTENGQVLPLGKGLWATATPSAPAHRYFQAIDVDAGQAVYWGASREGGELVIFGLRFRVEAGGLAEIETMVVRRPPEGGHPRVFAPEAMLSARYDFSRVIDAAKRTSRERLIECADLYLEGILHGDGAMIPVMPSCVRVENGVQTVLNQKRDEDLGSLGVADQISSGIFRDIETARDRRVLAIDVERGLIVLAFSFDHPGPVTKSSFKSRFDQPNSMAAFEVFKVKAGQIIQIESILNVVLYGMKSGWD